MNNWDRWILIRRARGPVYILTAGILGMFAEWTPFGWGRTWPVWIIVTGLLMFAEHSARASAMADGEFPAAPPLYPPPVYPSGPGTEIAPPPPQYPPNEPIDPR